MSKLLFICGFPSGGTDLTQTILNAHPDICLAGEIPWLKDIARRGYDATTTFSNIEAVRVFQCLLARLDRWHRLGNLSHDFTSDLHSKGTLSIQDVLRVCCLARDAEVWGNKTPQNTEHIDTLLELFPNARFLIVTRDVRDVCLSWSKKWGKDMFWCAAKWAERMATGKRTTDNLSQDCYLYVRFEDLISDTEEVCVKVCRFLDVPFSSRMLEHHKYMREQIDGKINWGQPIKADNFRKWTKELPKQSIKRIEEIACQTMNMFGYRVEYATLHRPISLFETWHGKWRDGWAMLLVGNRYAQRNSFWQRLQVVRDQLYWRLWE